LLLLLLFCRRTQKDTRTNTKKKLKP